MQRLEVLEHEEMKAGERVQLKIFEQLRELRRVLQLEKEARLVEEDKVRVVLEEYQVALQQVCVCVRVCVCVCVRERERERERVRRTEAVRN